LSALDIPDFDCFVEADCDEVLVVGSKDQPIDGAFVALELKGEVAGIVAGTAGDCRRAFATR
jgi:hypothetical protein